MPTYEYECERCGHRFERFQSMTDAPVRRCPECRGKTRRLIGTGAGIIFKGSGFYETDYRSAGYKEAAKKEKTESSSIADSKSKESKPSESKKKAKETAGKAEAKAAQ